MKLIVLSHLYPRKANPVLGVFVHEQVKALMSRGMNVKVLSGEPFWINTLDPLRIFQALRSYSKIQNRWTSYEGVEVCYFPYITGWICPFECHSQAYSYAAKRAIASLGLSGVDLVHAHTSYLDGYAAYRIGKRFDIPYLLTEHTGPFETIARNSLLRYHTRKAVINAARLVAVSPALQDDMRFHLSLDDDFVIEKLPNGVDVDLFAPSVAAKTRKVVSALWVGSHVRVKRVDVLLRSFRIASQLEPRLRLTLIGDGELKAAAREVIRDLSLADLVTVKPSLNRKGIADAMRDSDFLVISSETETFGVVAIEALSCGVPVLSTRCGGPESIISDGVTGVLVEQGEESLADGFVQMCQKVDASEFDGGKIRRHAVSGFSSNSVVRALEGLYRVVLTKPELLPRLPEN